MEKLTKKTRGKLNRWSYFGMTLKELKFTMLKLVNHVFHLLIFLALGRGCIQLRRSEHANKNAESMWRLWKCDTIPEQTRCVQMFSVWLEVQ